jgi:Coenzyme PQQ synthesis protein D (PqqD)
MNLPKVEYEISESSVIVAASEQISSDIGGEAVILNLKTGVYHGLNEVGARIWALIQEPLAVSDIQQTVLEEYEIEASTCLIDIFALLQNLQAAGLIEVQNEKTA